MHSARLMGGHCVVVGLFLWLGWLSEEEYGVAKQRRGSEEETENEKSTERAPYYLYFGHGVERGLAKPRCSMLDS